MNSSNLLSIGEIAQAIGITRKILLNYESKGLIVPDRKEGEKGNRYYTIDTFTKIRTIRMFQDLGLSLDEIRYYFDEDADLQPAIKRLEAMRDKLNLTIEKLKERTHTENNEIKIISFEAQTVYFHSTNTHSIEDKTALLRNTALNAMKLYGTDITRRMYFTEYSVQTPETVTYCVAVPAESQGECVQTLPPCKAVSYYHHGSYDQLSEVRRKLIDYAQQHNLQLTGQFRHIYLEGPPQHKDPAHFITQIVAVIKE